MAEGLSFDLALFAVLLVLGFVLGEMLRRERLLKRRFFIPVCRSSAPALPWRYLQRLQPDRAQQSCQSLC